MLFQLRKSWGGFTLASEEKIISHTWCIPLWQSNESLAEKVPPRVHKNHFPADLPCGKSLCWGQLCFPWGYDWLWCLTVRSSHAQKRDYTQPKLICHLTKLDIQKFIFPTTFDIYSTYKYSIHTSIYTPLKPKSQIFLKIRPNKHKVSPLKKKKTLWFISFLDSRYLQIRPLNEDLKKGTVT